MKENMGKGKHGYMIKGCFNFFLKGNDDVYSNRF